MTMDIRRPAEWEQHEATILVWPHNRQTWPGDTFTRVESVFKQVIETISLSEPVYVLVNDEVIPDKAEKVISTLDGVRRIKLVMCPVNDMWVRDTGPVCIKIKDQKHFLDFRFNAWGEKYSPWMDDNRLPGKLAEYFNIPVDHIPLTLEGGAIECNGNHTLITTESVLLNENRGNGDKKEIERILRKSMGIDHVIWLAGGLTGDDTDGHVDDLVRFVDHNVVVAVRCDRKSDPNYEVLEENYRRLTKSVTAENCAIEIIELPLPEPELDQPAVDGSEYFPASYANFYITNRQVILPLFDTRYDSDMVDLFSGLFPEREVVGIEAADLVWGQGSFHCITQEIFA